MAGTSHTRAKPAIVVTGASSGIGRELARTGVHGDHVIVLVARSLRNLDSLAAELTAAHSQAVVLAVDLADVDSGSAIESALNERGLYCDVLVNSAGFGLVGSAIGLDRFEQLKMLDVNVRALTELTLRFLPGMVARGSGGVLNIGSILGYGPGPNMAIYHASKAYVRSFTAALAAEVARTGAAVTCLSPGVVRTPFLDLLPIKSSRLFKLMPRSNAADVAEAGWRAFRARRRVFIPRLIDRLIAASLVLLPNRLTPHMRCNIFLPRQNHVSTQPAIVVTGAASGIGREIARTAARERLCLLLIDRSRDALARVESELTKEGAPARVLPLDLTSVGAGDAIEDTLREAGLHCDVLVNSAGIGLFGRATELSLTEQMKLLDVNARALTDLTLRFLPGMVARGRGGILNVGSLAGYTPGPNMAIYHASKAYVRSFSAALATEVAGTGVTVTCLSPGFVRTPFLDQLPIKRSRLFKLMPRSNAADVAEAGWRAFRAGRSLVIPKLTDSALAALFALLPARAAPRLPDRPGARD